MVVKLGTSAFAVALLLTSSACGALDEFEVVIEDEATIPASAQVGAPVSPTYAGGFNSLTLSADKTFANNDVKPEDVDAIFVKSVVVADSEPRLNNFKIVDSIELFVSAEGLEKKKIASGSSFPEGATVTLSIEPGVNLQPYATKEQMTVSAEIKLKMPPGMFGFKLKTTVTLLVDVNLLGA